jgi:hypothetical protein
MTALRRTAQRKTADLSAVTIVFGIALAVVPISVRAETKVGGAAAPQSIIDGILIGLGFECLIEHLGRQNALGNYDFQDRRYRVREGHLRIAKTVILILTRGGHGFLSLIWWMPIRIQATGMAVITIPTFLLGLHVFVSCIQRVESA